ncbi:hypothetical protein P775_14690 [Puniceibacterium antarcticum]|uniref:Uncharacterized protein n=1 Tax=Puniceibacterium antarcticum TaxID=1206336 RepID=A0A2G8RCS8_9RHOB|nr:hypothetical protein P775_14690 [Puniceibacterium antarcticum]
MGKRSVVLKRGLSALAASPDITTAVAAPISRMVFLFSVMVFLTRKLKVS